MCVKRDHSSKFTILVSTLEECSMDVISNFCFQSSAVTLSMWIPFSFSTGISSSRDYMPIDRKYPTEQSAYNITKNACFKLFSKNFRALLIKIPASRSLRCMDILIFAYYFLMVLLANRSSSSVFFPKELSKYTIVYSRVLGLKIENMCLFSRTVILDRYTVGMKLSSIFGKYSLPNTSCTSSSRYKGKCFDIFHKFPFFNTKFVARGIFVS